jgi:hypothetical protein
MLLTLAILLLIAWLIGFFAFNIGAAAYHILLGLAVLLFIIWLVRLGTSRRPTTP